MSFSHNACMLTMQLNNSNFHLIYINFPADGSYGSKHVGSVTVNNVFVYTFMCTADGNFPTIHKISVCLAINMYCICTECCAFCKLFCVS